MTTKHKPATPLPWDFAIDTNSCAKVTNGEGDSFGESVAVMPCTRNQDDDAAYIAHAANAYPRLVEALRYVLAHPGDKAQETRGITLLRELGEAE